MRDYICNLAGIAQYHTQHIGKIGHDSQYHYYQADENNPKSPFLHVTATTVSLSFSWSRLLQSSEDREAAERQHRNAHNAEAQKDVKQHN